MFSMVRCPCCRNRTIEERNNNEICRVCFWQDDGQDDQDQDDVRGGPNGLLSLKQARLNYAKYGASDPKLMKLVRSPTDAER